MVGLNYSEIVGVIDILLREKFTVRKPSRYSKCFGRGLLEVIREACGNTALSTLLGFGGVGRSRGNRSLIILCSP